MTDNNDNKKQYFDIHASIVFQLGESLISDPVQAIVELIKNAYDADSKNVTVNIYPSKENDIPNSRYKDTPGFIEIRDTGDGMSEEQIIKGWLTISNSLKRQMKKQGEKTKSGRTPLGDKGLGRLGAQRLGNNLEIFTKQEGAPFEYHVAFSWKDFENRSKLNDVEIYMKKIPSNRIKGTILLISDLKEQDFFKGDRAKENLQKEISSMFSPYDEINGFKIIIRLNDGEIDLASFNKKVLNTSQVNYKFSSDGEVFKAIGKVRFNFFRPQVKKEIEAFRQLVEVDKGKAFFDFLQNQKKAIEICLKRSSLGDWFLEYEKQWNFKNYDSLELVNGEAANPGKFSGRIDSFDLSPHDDAYRSTFDTLSEYKKYIKNFYGINVYRDGFRIRIDRDWLGLAKQVTSGRSFYGLRVENTLGYIALSAKDNINLEETTDREGFKKNPYFNNFFEQLSRFISFTGATQAFLRRGWIDFYEKRQKEIAEVETGISPEELSDKIVQILSKASAYRTNVEDLKIILKNKVEDTQEKISSITNAFKSGTPGIIDLKTLVSTLRKHINEALEIVSQVDDYLKEIGNLEARVKVLESQISVLREQVTDFFETASLGLTAEVLSHEIHNIGDRLADRTGKLRTYLKSHVKIDPKILAYIEHVDASISALRKQLSHLAPSFKYTRDKREKIELFPFCREVAYFYHDRFKNNHIDVQISPNNVDAFFININRGKLTQIFDNLFLNSEYWLSEDLRTKNIANARINITIEKPFVRFSDNGRGIDPSIEAILFEPFVTTKGKDKGRGLGLYIVQQFLEMEGCTISLLPDRNKNGRLYIFEINFTGGMNDS